MSSTSHRDLRPALPEHLDTPLHRTLVTLGLFGPLRRVSRAIYRFKTQRRALKGRGLVPEDQLRETYEAAIMTLRDRIGEDIGDYVEFGVCHGSSMACMHDALIKTGMAGVRKFGFDSFQGLPPEADHQDGGFFSKGQFDSSLPFTRKLLTRRGIDWDTTFLIQGWFRDTCVTETVERYGLSNVGIVMIDCDIYSAAKEALDFVGPLLGQEAIIVFDDWNSGDLAVRNMGERRAYEEFMAENRGRFVAFRLPEIYSNSAVFHLSRI